MPRLAPQFNGSPCVIEMRHTTGTAERQLLKRALDVYEKDRKWDNVPNYLMSGAAFTAALGVGFGLYKIGQGISMIDIDIGLPNIGDWLVTDNPSLGPAATHEGGIAPIELLIGYPEYTNYDTGTVHKNPFYKVPGFGALYGAGINIGIATGGWTENGLSGEYTGKSGWPWNW